MSIITLDNVQVHANERSPHYSLPFLSFIKIRFGWKVIAVWPRFTEIASSSPQSAMFFHTQKPEGGGCVCDAQDSGCVSTVLLVQKCLLDSWTTSLNTFLMLFESRHLCNFTKLTSAVIGQASRSEKGFKVLTYLTYSSFLSQTILWKQQSAALWMFCRRRWE